MGNNEIITTTANTLQTDLAPQERAALLNSRINANAQIMGNLIASTGRDLKEMRDKKLYIHMGCETFDEYCEKFTPYKKRNCYNFIQCLEEYGDERLEELADLGITKLTKLLALNTQDREELIESGEAKTSSTRELDKRIKELQNKNEQLTLELDEKNKEESDAAALRENNERLSAELEAAKNTQQAAEQREKELKERLIALEQSNAELSKRPVEVAVEKPSAEEIAKIEKAAVKKAEKAARKQREEEIKKLREELEKKAETERLAAVEAAKRDNLAKIKQLESEKAALQANAKKAPPSTQKERVKFYLEECLRSFNAAVEAFNSLPDEEREKPKTAIKTMVEKMAEATKILDEKGDKS